MADLGLTTRQAGYVQTILAAGSAHNTQDREIAVMVALTESGLENLANSSIPESLRYDHDGVGKDHASLGIFQQQTPDWGTVAQLMDPATAAAKFFDALGKVPLRGHMSPWAAAQAVQKSAFSDGSNYEKNFPRAQQIMDGMGGGSGGPIGAGLADPSRSSNGLTAVLAWMGNGANWARVGLFALGAALILLALWRMVKDTAPARAMVKAAETAAVL